jgi:hypothetical protein
MLKRIHKFGTFVKSCVADKIGVDKVEFSSLSSQIAWRGPNKNASTRFSRFVKGLSTRPWTERARPIVGRHRTIIETKGMNEQVTIQVSDRVVRQAAHVAAKSRRRVEEVLADWLEWAVAEIPVESLPDEDVLSLIELQLSAEQQATLDGLLEQNREGTLDAGGRRQLDELMRIYEHGLLRKAQALRVAVQRGLREPLQP